MPNQRRSDISRDMKPERHPKLAHLTEPQMQTLVERYYAGVRTSDLVAEFGIGARASDLVKLSPPHVLDTQCPYCAVSLWQAPRSKSASSAPLPYCPQCRHEQAYGRNYERHRSELSLVLHDVFLKIGELGFTTAPGRAFIQSPSAGWIEAGADLAAAAPTPTTPGS